MKFSIFNFQFSISKKGFTFIDVLIGISLMLIIFLGIFAAFQIGFKIVEQSKNKITASAIASGEVEKIRNLSYESVGIKSGFPDGVLDSVTNIIQNGINFKVERRIDYVIDPTDGIAPPDDECPNDYKKVEIKVSWESRLKGEIKILSDVAPKNLSQECLEVGGILSVSVFDAYGVMVPSPLIEIKNPATNEVVKTATPIEGKHYFSLPPATYRVVISKTGYSIEQTYASGETYNGEIIITPEKSNPIILENQLTEISFSTDRLGSLLVNTLSPWGIDSFSDSLLNESKISQSSNVTVLNGEVNLTQVENQYQSPGYLISTTILPENLVNWRELSFSDLKPVETQILYQVLYFDGTDWILIPDNDLPQNSVGFETSPVDLSGLNIINYSKLRIKGTLSTLNTAVSPTLYDWQVSWIDSQPTPIPSVSFHLRGIKTVGTDASENQIYKYFQDHISNSSGYKAISNLEWDSYTFSINPISNLDLVNIDPSPQPINLSPDTALSVKLYLDAEQSLLITVQDNETLEPIFSASARLYNNGLGYNTTQYTNEKGQTYFIPLETATYNLEINASVYEVYSTSVSVSGDMTKIIKIKRIE